MKAINECRAAFITWNLLGKGKESRVLGNYRYYNSVMYYQNMPSQRFVQAKDGRKHLLVRYMTSAMPDWAADKGSVSLGVPDIAVFSQFPGDWLDDPDEIHGRVKYMMLLIAEDVVNQARGLSGEYICKPGRSFRRDTKSTMETRINCQAKNWRSYSDAFRLGWPRFPGLYLNQLTEIVDEKIKAYNDPASVAKRERAAARKAAKKALGVD